MAGNQRFQVQPGVQDSYQDDHHHNVSGQSPQVSFNIGPGNYNTMEQPSKFKMVKRNNDLD